MLSYDPEVITIEELCERLTISQTLAYRMLRNGDIKAFKIGSLWRIPISSVNEYITQKCVAQSDSISGTKK